MHVPLTITDFLDRAVLAYGDRCAVVDEPDVAGSWGRIDYRTLQRRAWGLAHHLDARGVAPGERVAVVSQNASRFLCAFWGISGHGRVIVPVNYRLLPDEIDYILRHSESTAVLLDPELDDQVLAPDVRCRIVMDGRQDLDTWTEANQPPDGGPWPTAESDAASINYTSGTTARPKGVVITHRNMWINATLLGWHLGVSDRDVLLHTLPMFHCNGWGMPFAAAAMGAKQVVVRKVDGEEILRRIAEEQVTLLCGAPAVVAQVLDAASTRLERGDPVPGNGTVRVLVAGAPPPSRQIERVIDELGWEFCQLYGLTESSPLLTVNRNRAEWDALPVPERSRLLSRAGVPAVGTRIRIGMDGEVLARSNTVFAEYWRQPEASDAALADGWFHTGDGGFVEQGVLTISDRKKDVIVTGGENVSSIEVEDVLARHPAVAEVAVIGVPDEVWGEAVKALVVLRAGTSVDEAALIEHARGELAGYKCPKSVEFRDQLERTATGKVQKARLRAPYWAGLSRQVN